MNIINIILVVTILAILFFAIVGVMATWQQYKDDKWEKKHGWKLREEKMNDWCKDWTEEDFKKARNHFYGIKD